MAETKEIRKRLPKERAYEIFQQAIAVLCWNNGGSITFGPLPDDLKDRDFRVVTRFLKDGSVSFTVEHPDIQ